MRSTIPVLLVLLMLTAQPLPAQGPVARSGVFNVYSRLDQLTDEDRSYVITPGVAPNATRRPMLAWRCMDDGLNVMYSFERYFAGDSDDEVSVELRFDREPPIPAMYWTLSTDHRAVFLPTEMVSAFTTLARASSRVVLRVHDKDGERLTDEFSLAGLTDALRYLSCAKGALTRPTSRTNRSGE